MNERSRLVLKEPKQGFRRHRPVVPLLSGLSFASSSAYWRTERAATINALSSRVKAEGLPRSAYRRVRLDRVDALVDGNLGTPLLVRSHVERAVQ